MKNYVKNALDTLHGLGFQLDHEDRKLRTDRWIFTHANEPDTRLTLNYRMSEPAARTIVKRAKQVVGLATSETDKPKRGPKIDARQKAERAAQRAQREAARLAAEARAAEHEAQKLVSQRHRQVSELDRLIRGRAGGANANDVAWNAMLTVEQVADQTGVTDKAVRRAIETGALEAYQVGKVVKVTGADVRSWLGGAA